MLAKAHLALTAVVLALAAILLLEWRGERRDRAQLQATLATAKQSLQRATTAQQERDKQLADTVGRLESLKTTVRTQQEILAHLPQVLPLPTPLTVASTHSSSQSVGSTDGPSAANKPLDALPATQTRPPTAIPTEDLKPLYDFAVDCQTCKASLAAAAADLADERTKTAALSRERDAALKLAKGGSLRQRVGRSLKWLAVGAVVGFVAAKSH